MIYRNGKVIKRYKDIIKDIALHCNLTKTQTRYIFSVIFSMIIKNVRKGNSINLKNFGTFKLLIKKPRTIKCNFNNSIIDVKEKQCVKFVQSSNFFKDKKKKRRRIKKDE